MSRYNAPMKMKNNMNNLKNIKIKSEMSSLPSRK